jgi:2-C-methyl-D-erythritol 4-phosphate cytidylyltransferase
MALHEHDDRALFLVVAAGRGARAGAGGPKQYRELAGRQVLTRTLEALLGAEPEAHALVVIHRDDLEFYNTAIAPLPEILRARLHAPASAGRRGRTASATALRRWPPPARQPPRRC